MSHRPPERRGGFWGAFLPGAVLLSGLVACADAAPEGPPGTGVTEKPQVCATWEKPRVQAQSQCGLLQDFTPVNRYQGVFADVVEATEDAVVLINGSCTGTLIAASAGPVVITAGHCVGLGDRSVVAFNYEDAPDGDPLVTEGTVIEQALEPDYALIRLDTLPAVVPVALTVRPTERLAILQHPRGRPKAVAEGRFEAACDGRFYYSNLDTLVGSSGAGVLTQAGRLLGVHTDGDCDRLGRGTNQGWTTEALVEASSYLQDGDIAER
jgi:hypothetical protein